MEVSGYVDRTFNLDECRLFLEDFLALFDEPSNGLVGQVDESAYFHVFRVIQLVNDVVEGKLAFPLRSRLCPLFRVLAIDFDQIKLFIVGDVGVSDHLKMIVVWLK